MSNSIRKIMEMVDNVESTDSFSDKVWALQKYGVPDNVIEELINEYDSYGEIRWEEGIEFEQENRRTSRQEF